MSEPLFDVPATCIRCQGKGQVLDTQLAAWVACPVCAAPQGFNAEAGRQARDEAMGRVRRNADPELTKTIYAIVVQVAREADEFTTDRVQWEIERRGIPLPHEPRVFGPIMKQAQRDRVIAHTDRTVLSIRKSNHRRPVRVWRSLIKEDDR